MRNENTTRKTEGLGNTKNPTTATATQTPKGVSARYSDLLACFAPYDPNGELPLKGNCLGKSEDGKVHYYCEAVEVVINTPDGKTVGLGKNPYEWFCHSVAKKWAFHRDWLPDSALSATEQNEAEVSGTLFECLHDGVDPDEIVDKCYKALDAKYKAYKQDAHKTEPRCEYEWKAQRAFTATLFSADLSTVGGTVADLDPNSEYGGLTLEESEKLERLVELFNAVKEAHKFATPEKWLCAQCYALNMPTEVAIERVYGEAIKVASAKSQKALDKAVNSCRVKYSRHANEVFGWVLDEVEKRLTAVDELIEALKNCETILAETQDTKVVNEVHERQAELRKALCEAEKSCDGYGKWADVLNRCKATAEATVTLEECAVKFSLNDEVVKFLRSRLNALPHQVLRYCEAVRAGATA